jgi:putative ABC transport system substrate-binding protein
MRRREFVTILGGLAFWPLEASAQSSGPIQQIGVLMAPAEHDAEIQPRLKAFREHLQELGWIEGRSIRIEPRWAGGNPDRMRQFAKELVALRPSLIVVGTSRPASLLRLETTTIPIVFIAVSDPVAIGLVASVPRPGGNATGFVDSEPPMAGKWVELLKTIAPNVGRVALLFNPDTSLTSDSFLQSFEAAARSFAIEPIAAPARNAAEIEVIVASLGHQPNGGLVVMADVFTTLHRDKIIALAAKHRLPAIYPSRYYVINGGLISYGVDIVDLWRRAAVYVDRILRGADPGDLPVQAPTKFDLTINLSAAAALGLTPPAPLLGLADEVIE